MAVHDSSRELAVSVHRNAVIYPTVRAASNDPWFRERLWMGVYGEHGEFIPGTQLQRRFGEQGVAVPPSFFPEPVDSPLPEVHYGGMLYMHFGHFLVESLARAWSFQQAPEVPIVWVGASGWDDAKIAGWMREIMAVLGITNELHYVTTPTRFASVRIADIGYHYDDWFHPQHARFLAQYEGPAQEPDLKLWLSRSQLATDVKNLNAAATERRLERLGWTIEYPEKISVREQLDLMARASLVAGEEGSAFHLLMLLKDVSAKKYIVFRRRGDEHRNMLTVGDARAIDQTFVTIEGEKILHAKGREVTKLTPNASAVLDALDEPILPITAAPPRAEEVALLDALAEGLGARRFLDVQGADGAVFRAVSTVPVKVSVGDEFSFDPREFRSEPGDYFELDFENYISTFLNGRFDLIRVSAKGLGVADVVYRFEKSRQAAHRGTVWLLNAGDQADRIAPMIRQFFPGFATHDLRGVRGGVLVWLPTGAARTIREVGELDRRAFRRFRRSRTFRTDRAAIAAIVRALGARSDPGTGT